MHIHQILSGQETKFSFEFFPPKTPEGTAALTRCLTELRPYSPTFASVTYGAGGGSREATHDLVDRMSRDSGIPIIPHLTAIGHTEREIEEILTRHATAGVANILALRGDPPRQGPSHPGDFPYCADLVAFIRRFSERHGHPFGIGVAGFPEGHPSTPNRLLELDHLKAKIDAGADYICTQLFFENHDFLDYRDRCDLAGIRVPILAGIMPVTSTTGLRRMAELAPRSRVPARLLKALARAEGDEAVVRRIGIHHAAEQCARLIDHRVSGIHFYTLNQAAATRDIFRALGLERAAA